MIPLRQSSKCTQRSPWVCAHHSGSRDALCCATQHQRGRKRLKRTVKMFNWDTSHKKNWTGKKTKNSGAHWERFKTAEITVVKGGEAIAMLVQAKWQMSSGSFPAVGNSDITTDFFFERVYLRPRPGGPDWRTAVRVAGLPPGQDRLDTLSVRQVSYVSLAGPLDALDRPRLLPSSTAPAACPPLSHRPAGMTQHKPAESTSGS